jgi:hypothetical protein
MLWVRPPLRARSTTLYVIKFVSDLRQVGGFLRVLRFPPPIKLTRHDIAEIVLRVALNTIKPTNLYSTTEYFDYE